MKKQLLLFILIVFSGSLSAQISITASDMPNVGDTLRVSEASVLSPVDLTLTGANYTWDFSWLLPVAQDVDTFVAVSSTPTLLAIFFTNLSFNTNRASIAELGTNNALASQLPVSDVYSFFYETTSSFKQVGFGATLGTTAVPLGYGNKDIVYNFPVNFGDQDSSDSDYSVSLPNVLYAEGTQKRVNNVNGWGTLITPYGSFSTLRVVSVLTGQDSVYIDSTASGFSTARPLTKEYKWLGAGQSIPLLQITTAEVLGTETIASIRYRDSLRVNVGIPSFTGFQAAPLLYPNPASAGNIFASLNLEKQAVVSIDLMSAEGRLVKNFQLNLPAGEQNIALRSSDLQLNAGVYLVRFSIGSAVKTVKLVVEP